MTAHEHETTSAELADIAAGTAATATGTAGIGEEPTTTGRKRRLLRQFIQFGVVGASGFVVNQAVFVASKKLTLSAWAIGELDPFLNLLGSQFHIRWYHVFSVIAFVVANVWNFSLNRYWTFRGVPKRAWWKQLPQFMAVGVFGLLITLVVSTALVNPESPLALPRDFFDSSSGLRTAAYWGNFIGVMVAIPTNFLFNKLWTFRPGKPKPEGSRVVTEVPPRGSE